MPPSFQDFQGPLTGSRVQPPPELANRRILVVEDYPQNRDLIMRFLQFAGVVADSAPDGQAGLERFQAEPYDLVLMDIQLPVFDGCEVTRRIRAWEREQKRAPVPVIAVSANSREADWRRAREAGCTLFIAKPISPRGLLDTLVEVLKIQGPAQS